MIREREYNGLPGIPVLLALLVVDAGLVWALVTVHPGREPGRHLARRRSAWRSSPS